LPSGEEIQASLRAFAERWGQHAGSERGEAQTFLNELFAGYDTDRPFGSAGGAVSGRT
jgi:hypothetical protein